MNWTLKSTPLKDGNYGHIITDHARLMAEGIEKWLEEFLPFEEAQPEPFMAEYPEGFFRHQGHIAYRFEYTVGFYKDGKYIRMGEIPYNVTIERATPAVYCQDLGIKTSETPFGKHLRRRYIDNVEGIS